MMKMIEFLGIDCIENRLLIGVCNKVHGNFEHSGN